jgi:hypothetical protein
MAVNATVTGTSYNYSLGAATKYYWRVAATNGGFMSDYTAPFNFTTAGSAAAQVPTIIAPVNGSTNQPASLTLKVRRTSDASRYQWQVSVLPTFVTFVVNDSTADTTYSGQFAGGQRFYLRVRGMNDLGRSTFSVVDTFTIMTPPARTTLVSPANNATNVIADSLVFVWRLVGTAQTYNLQVSTVNSTTTYTGITDTTYMVRGLTRLTNYNWKVEAINAGGTSYFTAPFTFTTIIAAPGAPTLVLPAANAGGVNRLARFSWTPVVNATRYHLQIATDNTFGTIVQDTVRFEDTTVTLTRPLASNTDFFWRVSAANIGGEGTFSTSRLFTTGTALDVKEVGGIPGEFALLQNYPNPFNPTTTIQYDVPKAAHVKIIIYDILGREVTTLVNEVQVASRYKVEWNPSGLSTGVYFYRMEARSQDGKDNFTTVRKLLFMK